MSGKVLLYGATGYTGRLIAARLARQGVKVVVAGRDPERVRAMARSLAVEGRAFSLDLPRHIDAALADVDLVLHAAGPFLETAPAMMSACLRAGAHYLDLAGEWPVFAQAMDLDAAAVAAGVMVMPGVGLTIAVTDCLLALAHRSQPDAVALRVAMSWPQVLSRGSVLTAAQIFGPHALVRRDGRLHAVAGGRVTRAFDFGHGLRDATAFSGPEVVAGQHTTGVPNIEIYAEVDWAKRVSYRGATMAMALTGSEPWTLASAAIGAIWPKAPSAEARHRAGYVMVAEAIDPWRRVSSLRIRTFDGYTASVLTAVGAVERVLGGTWARGFQTPALIFGPDFIFEVGCASVDGPSRQMTGEAA